MPVRPRRRVSQRRRTSTKILVSFAFLAAVALVTVAVDDTGDASFGVPTVGGETVSAVNTPFTPDASSCDTQGWHVAMDGVDSASFRKKNFDIVSLSFEDGSVGAAVFLGGSDGDVHWYYRPVSGAVPQTVVSASTTFPDDTEVAGYDGLSVVAAACYEP